MQTTTNGKAFRLMRSEVLPLTRELAQRFREMEASPTERELDGKRVTHLREKIEAGLGVNFLWATARLGEKTLRMNGQHSSEMLSQLNGSFPEDLKVHLDEYEVDDLPGLALLFRQFDDRKSGRTPGDVAGAYQGLYPELRGIPKPTAKLGIEGIAWHTRVIEGAPIPSGDEVFSLFGRAGYHDFLHWLGELFSIKTPELKRAPIVAAMYATWLANDEQTKAFWGTVARGGVEYEDNAPATILDSWLKKQKTDPDELKPADFYRGCVYAWNAHREEKSLREIRFDKDRKAIG